MLYLSKYNYAYINSANLIIKPGDFLRFSTTASDIYEIIRIDKDKDYILIVYDNYQYLNSYVSKMYTNTASITGFDSPTLEIIPREEKLKILRMLNRIG